MNYYFKRNELSYTKAFDKMKEKYDLQGQIRSNSIIMCEMVFTSDKEFFDTIVMEETKRYFEESYNFICNYKNLIPAALSLQTHIKYPVNKIKFICFIGIAVIFIYCAVTV